MRARVRRGTGLRTLQSRGASVGTRKIYGLIKILINSIHTQLGVTPSLHSTVSVRAGGVRVSFLIMCACTCVCVGVFVGVCMCGHSLSTSPYDCIYLGGLHRTRTQCTVHVEAY